MAEGIVRRAADDMHSNYDDLLMELALRTAVAISRLGS